MIRTKIIALCSLIGFCTLANAQTPKPVDDLLQAPFMKGATFSLVAEDLQNGKRVYSYDEDRLVSPASVLKTVATATALELLGEDFRFSTSIEYDGVIENGVLKGNLYIKGGGDPSLGSAHFGAEAADFAKDWTAAIRKAGIRRIDGAIISDESLFDTEGSSAQWIRQDMGNYYAPGCYGLSVFDNLYKLTFQTGAAGTRPVIKGCDPEIPGIRFINHLAAAAVSSDSAYIYGAPLAHERYLYGVIPSDRTQYTIKGDIPDPALFLAQYFTGQLKQGGITVKSAASSYRIETEAGRWQNAPRKPIVTTRSPALREIIRVTNHVSHNLFADALLKTVGLQYQPAKGETISSFTRGVRVVQAYWKKKGLDISGLQIHDGSGLAPADKVSARFIADMLRYMATLSPAKEAFIASLPQPGIEGSVRNFLKGSKLQGKTRLKSGGITGVRSYAGYITVGGRKYGVAVFSNNYSCSMAQMTKGLEKLLTTLFDSDQAHITLCLNDKPTAAAPSSPETP